MRATVYKCNQCKKVIGEKPHITLGLQDNISGIAMPPRVFGTWRVNHFEETFIHFCNENCISKYMKNELDKASKYNETINPTGQKKEKKAVA